MKKTALILCIVLPIMAMGQDYEYEIRQNATDTTKFNLDVITVINAARQSIQRTIGLDTAGLQTRQYTEAQSRYERLARALYEKDQYQRQVSNILASLTSLGLNDYVNWQVIRNDSTFQGDAKYRDENHTLIDCYVFPRNNQVPILKLDSDNSNVATITFLSRNYIRLNWVTANGYGNGDTQTFFYSVDGRRYAGYDAAGDRHIIVFETQ